MEKGKGKGLFADHTSFSLKWAAWLAVVYNWGFNKWICLAVVYNWGFNNWICKWICLSMYIFLTQGYPMWNVFIRLYISIIMVF